MADQKKDAKQGKESSSEGFGFKQSPLGFDKNEVNLYINKLKKQMREQEQEFNQRLSNLQKNIEDVTKEANEAKNAARNAGTPAPVEPKVIVKDNSAETKKLLDDMKAESDKKIMDLRKLVLDERRKVAKFDKDCAMAQMSERKVREEYEKLKEKYLSAKKNASGGKAVTTTNADEVFAEAEKYAEELVAAAKSYSDSAVKAVNDYKAAVEAELADREKKLAALKTKLDEEVKKAEADKAAAEAQMKSVAEKISAVTSLFDSFAGQFDSVNEQIGKVTSQIDSVTGQFGTITKQFSGAAEQISSVSKQFSGAAEQITAVSNKINDTTAQINAVATQISETTGQIDGISKQITDTTGQIEATTKQIDEASKQMDGFSKTLEGTKSDISGLSQVVTDTKNSIGGVKSDVENAKKLADEAKPAAVNADGITAIGTELAGITGAIKATLSLPALDSSKFSTAKFAELKKKFKVETTYEGGDASEDEDEEFLSDDIISSIEVEAPEVPSDEELSSDIPDVIETPAVSEAAAPVEIKASEPEKNVEKPVASDDFEDFFISSGSGDDMTSSVPLVNTSGVGAVDDFSLDTPADDMADVPDFDLEPNDLTATPDKGSDLGEDIFDMAITPVGADDDTLATMMADAAAAEAAGDFELTPANISSDTKTTAASSKDDFGEFADLFAAGSAETTAPAKKKEKAPFRQPQNTSDDMWNFGSDDSSDNGSDLSADSDLSEFLL